MESWLGYLLVAHNPLGLTEPKGMNG
jgi:hypothetical protein